MEDVEKITKQNHDRAKYYNNELLQTGLKTYSNSKEYSVIRGEVRRSSSRKKVANNIRTRIMALVLAGTAVTSAYAALKDNNIEITNPITKISESIKHSNNIDEKIYNYQTMMNSIGEFAIETIVSSAPLQNQKELPVAYNENNYQNLVTVMQNSAKISEEEFRCAIIGAYKVINEPYREQVLNEGFVRASINQEGTTFTIPSSLNEYLNMLGYEDLEDYNNNERDNIKKLEQIEIKNEGRGK